MQGELTDVPRSERPHAFRARPGRVCRRSAAISRAAASRRQFGRYLSRLPGQLLCGTAKCREIAGRQAVRVHLAQLKKGNGQPFLLISNADRTSPLRDRVAWGTIKMLNEVVSRQNRRRRICKQARPRPRSEKKPRLAGISPRTSAPAGPRQAGKARRSNKRGPGPSRKARVKGPSRRAALGGLGKAA